MDYEQNKHIPTADETIVKIGENAPGIYETLKKCPIKMEETVFEQIKTKLIFTIIVIILSAAAFYIILPKYYFVVREGVPLFRCNIITGNIDLTDVAKKLKL